MPLTINATEFEFGSATSVSGDHNNTGGKELVCFLATPDAAGGAPSSVQYAGINMSAVEDRAVSNNVRVHIQKLSGALGGINQMAAQYPGISSGHMIAANWPNSRGILQSTGGTQTVGTSGSLSTSAATTIGSKIYMSLVGAGTDAFTETTGATLLYSGDYSTQVARLYEKDGTGGIVTFSWTFTFSARDLAFALVEIGHLIGGDQVILWS